MKKNNIGGSVKQKIKKKSSNPNPNKQVNEVTLSRKSNNRSHPIITFSNNDINKYPHNKHLGNSLYSKQDFKFHVDQKIKKYNK